MLNVSDPRYNNFLKCLACEAGKVVYAKSDDVCSLKKFMLLIFQTEAKSQMIRCHSVWGMFKDRCFVIFFP